MTVSARLLLFLFTASVAMGGSGHAQTRPDPFGFLQPAIQLSDDDRRRLDDRSVMVKILPAGGHELATFAAGALAAGPEALLASVRDIVELKKGRFVPEIGRFSAQPRLEDLRALTLDSVDVAEIKRCRPRRCGLKLEPEEIARLQQVISPNSDKPQASLEEEFRRVVLDRVTQYLERGDQRSRREFSTLLQNSPHIRSRLPEVGTYLEEYPALRLPEAESFLYWSKETYAWKPMITATHVTTMRGTGGAGMPAAIVVSRDVFSTRYTSGSLVVTLLFQDPADQKRHYLVYLNRTWVDGLRALWRPFVELRIRSSAKNVFATARERIERYGLVPTSAK